MTRFDAALIVRAAMALSAITAVAACTSAPSDSSSTTTSATTTATTVTTTTKAPDAMATPSTPADTAWHALVDATNSSAAWRAYKTQAFPTTWHLADGVMSKTGSVEDLISRDDFGDFELAWDWKVSPGGNAGIFYRANEEYDKVYWSGTEYQLLDDAKHPDGKSRLTSAGAAYGLYPAPAGIVKAGGEWNSSRIIARGPHIEHWLNGKKLLEYEAWSPEWEAKVKAAKFSAYPNYGRAKRGHIGIQGDHDGALSIRNMRIRGLQ